MLAAFDPTAVTVEGAETPRSSSPAARACSRSTTPPTPAASNDATAGVTLLVTETEARVIAFAAATADLTLAVAPPESACCERAP